MKHWLILLLMLLPTLSMAGHSFNAPPLPHELLPEVRDDLGECLRKDSRRVRALVVGINRYPGLKADLTGAENDAELIAAVLAKQGVEVFKLTGEVRRAAFVAQLMAQARLSRCGDTLLLYFSGMGDPSGANTNYQFLLHDAELGQNYPWTAMQGSQRSRRIYPGGVDPAELADFFDRLRDNGVNVVFIADTSSADRFLPIAGIHGNDYWSWKSHLAQSDQEKGLSRGGFFGIYGGESELELKLPPGDPEGKSHGLLTWAIATALGTSNHPTFRELSRTIRKSMEAGSGNFAKTLVAQWAPVFESTNPERFFLSTGLPLEGQGEIRMRGTDSRRIEISNPAMQRGAARVGNETMLIEGRVISTKPPKIVEANQVLGKVNPDGSFHIKLPLHRGENRIMLVAWWDDTDFLPSRFTVVSQEGEKVVQEGKRYAVLIANKDYQDAAYPILDTPIADSHALASLLKERYGFATSAHIGDKEVSLVLDNARRSDILGILSRLRGVLGTEDSLLIYYAGHGVYEKETNYAYWLPVDARKDEPENWVSDKDVSAAILRLNVRHVLVVADSCYSGAFRARGTGETIDKADMSRIQFLDQANLRLSRTFISSGANEPVLDGGGGGHSVFARAMINGLAGEVLPFTAGELVERHIKATVSGTSKQMPQYFPMKEGHEGGEFVFVPLVNGARH